MFRVKSETVCRITYYFVEDSRTGERKPGGFDCQRSAEAFAKYLNDKEEKESTDTKKRVVKNETFKKRSNKTT